jgi:hypothetical protein
MRQLTIIIQKRLNVDTDNEYVFQTEYSDSNNDPYQLESLVLNYSVISSQVTSTMVLGMNQPVDNSNILRSGQPISIQDNGTVVFEGVLLQPNYTLIPMQGDQPGGMFLFATLAPSIYQLTLSPMVFDNAQAQQINQLTGVNITAVLAANVVQKIATQSLLQYAITNTSYDNVFGRIIRAQDLPDEVFLITSTSESRDIAVRHSIDFSNCVMYQEEIGNIVIRQLDASIECPFDIDLQNNYNLDTTTNDQTANPYASLLSFQYQDNAYSTPAAISNYAILDPNLAATQTAVPVLLTYAPTSQYFPQIQNLQKGGWFVGQIGQTQLNTNVVSDPTTAEILAGYFAYPDAYMKASQATGIQDQKLASYQALLTAKQMGMALSGYASLSATISLDDPLIQNISAYDMAHVLGSVIQIQNCDLSAGLVATLSRSYNAMGSYMSFNVMPLGSYTGFWKNSTFKPAFSQ